MIKLIDILIETLADGQAFKAFTDYAVAKAETNEELVDGEDVLDQTSDYITINDDVLDSLEE